MDCSPSGSSVYGISQARILEWVAISFSKGSSLPRDWTWVSCIAGLFLLVMDREVWHAAVHGVTKSWTRLSNWTELKWTELLGKHAVYWCRWIIFSKSKKFKKTLKILLATKEYCRLHWNGLRVHAQSCPTLCDPMGNPPDSSVNGIFQARILEWVAISLSIKGLRIE